MKKPIVISFYTLGTPYEEEVKNLVDSCLKFEIETDIVGIENLGSWEKNCAMKPPFILQKLQEHNRPVFWVDADAVFRHEPDFTEFNGYDISVRLNEFLPLDHPSRIVSNAVYVDTTGLPVIEKWRRLTEQGMNEPGRILEFWDQMALRDALQQSSIRFYPMPLKYSKIFDFDDLFISESEVVIEHFQASRRLKHVVSDHCCH